MSVYYICTVPTGARRAHGSPVTGLTEGCEAPCGWEQGFLQKQSVFPTAEPSL